MLRFREWDANPRYRLLRPGTRTFHLYATPTCSHPYARDSFLTGMTQNYWSTPIMIWGGGMGGKNNTGDEARVEASAWPDNRKVPPVTKRNRKNRGMPPPAAFDIDTLPASSNLTAMEVAAAHARSARAVAARSEPLLKWRYVDGRPLYRVDAVRDYLAGCDKTTKRPQPHNVRGDDQAARP
jgi:hypothetical protein